MTDRRGGSAVRWRGWARCREDAAVAWDSGTLGLESNVSLYKGSGLGLDHGNLSALGLSANFIGSKEVLMGW